MLTAANKRRENKVKLMALFMLYVFVGSLFSGVVFAPDMPTDAEIYNMGTAELQTISDSGAIQKAVELGRGKDLSDTQVKKLSGDATIEKLIDSAPQKAKALSTSQIQSIQATRVLIKIINVDNTMTQFLKPEQAAGIDWKDPNFKGAKAYLKSSQIVAVLNKNPEGMGDLGELSQSEAVSALKEKFGLPPNVQITLGGGVYLTQNGNLWNKAYCDNKEITNSECIRLNLNSADKAQFKLIAAVPAGESSDAQYPGFLICIGDSCNVVSGEISKVEVVGGKVNIYFEGQDTPVVLGEDSNVQAIFDKNGNSILSMEDGAVVNFKGITIVARGTQVQTVIRPTPTGVEIEGAAEFYSSDSRLQGKQFGGKGRIDFDEYGRVKELDFESAQVDYLGNKFNGKIGLYFDGSKLLKYTLGPESWSLFTDKNGKYKKTKVPKGKTLTLFNDDDKLQKARGLQAQIATIIKNCNDNPKCKKIDTKQLQELYSQLDNLMPEDTAYFSFEKGEMSGEQVLRAGGGVVYEGFEADGKTQEFRITGQADGTVFSYVIPVIDELGEDTKGMIYFSNSERNAGELGTAQVRYDFKGDKSGSVDLMLKFNKENGVTSASLKIDGLLKDPELLKGVISPNIGIAFLSDEPGKIMYFKADEYGLRASFGDTKDGAWIGINAELNKIINELQIRDIYLERLEKDDISELTVVEKKILDAMVAYKNADTDEQKEQAKSSLLKILESEDNINERVKITVVLADMLKKENDIDEITNLFDDLIARASRLQIDQANKDRFFKAMAEQKAKYVCSGESVDAYSSCLSIISYLSDESKNALVSKFKESQRLNS